MESPDLEAQPPADTRARGVDDMAIEETPVLVAIDFSRNSEVALVWASIYANTIGAPLEILHVIHDPADSPGTYRPENGDLLEPMADVAHTKLMEFLDRIGRDRPDLANLRNAKRLCMPGLPASTILQVAEAQGAQHLVLGSRHHNGLARILHGSIAHQVAGHAEIPVTIV